MSLKLSRRETRRLIVLVVDRIKDLVIEQRLPVFQIHMKFLENTEPYIDKYKKLLQKRFGMMEKEVLAKIKKPGKSIYHETKEYWIDKDGFNVEKWLFSKKKWLGTFTKDGKLMTAAPMAEGGQHILDELDIAMTFDEADPLAIEWLATNSKKAAWSITNTAYERLRKALMEAVAAGESIPKIRERVRELFENISKVQAEMIARTETLKATNRGVWLGMKQSGVVEGKQWLAAMDERTCPSCEEMDGATMPLDDPFFEQGSVHTIGGVEMNFDYEEIMTPPIHPDCRCTLLAILKEV